MTSEETRFLDQYREHLLGVEIAALWRLCAVSDEGPIRLPDTVVLELVGGEFVSLT
ncbi:hypothetical protein [Actinomadura spongiicola]|uniref:hypothetical protein n=1 Tax=Actinomadura spongiicola TaxID=2303421 RepID=UPI001313E4AE|nr:hypothetical protein [Actinomadura spongiicola]